jgi:predicted ATPase
MIRKLVLKQFKNFKDAELVLGPLTILIGTNASGKSNLRDAFRFLHGIARGYTLPEIIGEKYGEGGVLQWRGIRGGPLEVISHGASQFSVEVTFDFEFEGRKSEARYAITVERNGQRGRLVVIQETLYHGDQIMYVRGPDQWVYVLNKAQFEVSEYLPALIQVETVFRHALPDDARAQEVLLVVRAAITQLGSMRFFDLSPEMMRSPSIPGQTVLGDRGENLSSILQAICEDPQGRQTLTSWIQELTPMDARSFEFPVDLTGKVLMTLVEENGQRTSAYSASDGTLRFLAILAALLGPDHARFYFFEELEQSIHPTRLHLLLELIERQSYQRGIQWVATTYSPQLINLLSSETRQSTSLIYRLPGQSDAKICGILDLPDEGSSVMARNGVVSPVLADVD